MPDLRIYLPVIGNTWAVGLAFQIHLVFVAFIMGIAIMAPAAEMLGRGRDGQYWDRLAHDLAATITRFFSFGATWAVLGLVLLFGLFPGLFGTLTAIFFWPLMAVAVIWFVMTVTAYLYAHTWTRFERHRWLHTLIGVTFAVSAFIFISLITQLSSYQLTPSNASDLLSAMLNPSWLTEIIHRHIGNLSYAGLILAGYAGANNLFSRQREIHRAYFDWLGNLGLLLGTSLVLLQPFAGWIYTRQIQAASPGAYERMMVGENSWLFLVQSLFFGLLLFLGNVYLASAIRRTEKNVGNPSVMKFCVRVVGVLALLLVVPKEWPLGQMTPWKYISLIGLVVFSLLNLVLYARARRGFVWGKVGQGSQMALALIGVTIIALIVTMGVIRESARGGQLIYQETSDSQSQPGQ